MMGRTIVMIGITLVVVGVLMMLGERRPLKLGRLPGDLVYRGENTTVHFPVVTSILLSVVLSLLMWLIGRR